MTPRKQMPRWKDGRIDPDWLGQAGLTFIESWLSERLSGRDPYQPIDHRVDEDPEALVVQILKDVGPQHEAFAAIAECVLLLLDKAKATPLQEPRYLEHLLRLCQVVQLPRVQAWFDEEVAALGEHDQARWSSATCQGIVYAALTQKAGAPVSWARLLEMPAYTTLALLALAPTLNLRVHHLAAWWKVVPESDRSRELQQILIGAFRDHEQAYVFKLLSEARSSFPATLNVALDATLLQQGRIAEGRIRRTSPIQGAAFRREFVLSQTRQTGAA